MKSLVALLLCVLTLAGGLVPRHDLAELGRLPRLLEHYRQHQATAGSGTLSFAGFLALHYGRPGRAAHHPDHEGLPLHDCHHTPVPVICTLTVWVGIAPPVWAAAVAEYLPASHGSSAGGYPPACWQPPCA